MEAKSTMQKLDLPVGAIYLDDLLQRYLIGIGLREFASLTQEEVSQFAFLSVFRAIQRYELIGANKETFWGQVMNGSHVAHVCLLPDTIEAREYFNRSGESAILVEGVKDVRALVRRVFLNLIVDEIRNEKNQEHIKDVMAREQSPLRRRRLAKDDSYQSLEAHAQNLDDQAKKADKEVLNAEVLALAIECLGSVGCDLLMTYMEYGVKHFQELYFKINGKRISDVAARKYCQRCIGKLAKYVQKKSKLNRVA